MTRARCQSPPCLTGVAFVHKPGISGIRQPVQPSDSTPGVSQGAPSQADLRAKFDLLVTGRFLQQNIQQFGPAHMLDFSTLSDKVEQAGEEGIRQAIGSAQTLQPWRKRSGVPTRHFAQYLVPGLTGKRCEFQTLIQEIARKACRQPGVRQNSSEVEFLPFFVARYRGAYILVS